MNKFTLLISFILLYNSAFATEMDLDADDVFVEQNEDITATKNVNANYLDHNLKSEFLKYEKSKQLVTAKDNVIYVNKFTGEKLYADMVFTNEEFNKIKAENALIILPNNSSFEAQRIERNTNKLVAYNGSFTNCTICKNNQRTIPEWKLSARKITYKENDKYIYFHHAFFKLFNVPVLYSPFFFRPAPGAKKESGFLNPSFTSNSIFGDMIVTPYFFNLAPNYDLTYTPTFYSKTNNLHNDFTFRYMDKHTTGDARLAFIRENSNLKQTLTEKNLNPDVGNYKKWIIDINNKTELKNNFGFESDLFDVSDKAYLERYEGNYTSYYNSTINLNKVNQDQAFYIDTSRYTEFTSDKTNNTSTFELPSISYSNRLKTKYNFLYDQDINFYSLTSDDFANRQNISYTGYLNRGSVFDSGYIVDYGLKNTFRAYNNDSSNNAALYAGYNLELIVNTKYPLVKKSKYNNYIITPQLNFLASPKSANSNSVTNISSATASLNYSNVTADNQISGSDLFEEGYRINYGLDKAIKNKYFNFSNFIGQAYFFSEQNLDRDTGIKKKFTDLAGTSKLDMFDTINLSYNYKIREEDFNPYQNQYSLGINTKKFELSVGYTKNKYHLVDSSSGKTDYINGEAKLYITDNIYIESEHQKDLLSKAINSKSGSIKSKTLLTIEGNCVDYYVEYTKNFLQTSNIENNYSIVFYFSIKGI